MSAIALALAEQNWIGFPIGARGRCVHLRWVIRVRPNLRFDQCPHDEGDRSELMIRRIGTSTRLGTDRQIAPDARVHSDTERQARKIGEPIDIALWIVASGILAKHCGVTVRSKHIDGNNIGFGYRTTVWQGGRRCRTTARYWTRWVETRAFHRAALQEIRIALNEV